MIPDHILNRKGARSLKDIKPEVIEYLNKGLVDTKNLMEWLATDQLALLKVVLKQIDKSDWFDHFEQIVNEQIKPTANSTAKLIGQTFGTLSSNKKIYKILKAHTSDLVRAWSCWAESIHFDNTDSLLKAMKPYAADSHFGLREVVIFATKDRLIEDLDKSIKMLLQWVEDSDENIRRYAVEAMRPIGVWTKKIPSFQVDPSQGFPLIESLYADPSKYVRDSVGNWLNDASKSNPEWVKAICEKWGLGSNAKETAYIIKKAMRTINKR